MILASSTVSSLPLPQAADRTRPAPLPLLLVRHIVAIFTQRQWLSMSFIDEELVVSIVSCGLQHAYCNNQHFVVLHVDLVVLPFTFQTHSIIHEQYKLMCVVVDFEMMSAENRPYIIV